MSESKHTPGPWKAGDYQEESNGLLRDAGFFIAPEKRGYDIADVPYMASRSRDEVAANARLIAAAPELLDALKMAEVYLGWGDCSLENVHNICRAAIAKAVQS